MNSDKTQSIIQSIPESDKSCVVNPEVQNNLKYLEEKIDQAIKLIAFLRQENSDLKERLREMQAINSQAVEKINFILDKINKMF